MSLSILQALGASSPSHPPAISARDPQSAVVATAPQGRLSETEYSIGAPQAEVTVLEYLSPTCPYCLAFNRNAFPQIERDYITTGKVLWIVRELPTAPARVSASIFLIARCAGGAGYWNVIQFAFAHRAELLNEMDLRRVVKPVAQAAGLSDDATARCMGDEVGISALNARVQAADAAGVTATPTFVINGRRLEAGVRLGGQVYLGGPLTAAQFDDVYRIAKRTRGAQGESGSPAAGP